MPQLSLRTSRRVQGLKDSDYDHEIGLVDEETPRQSGTRPSTSARNTTETPVDNAAGPSGTQRSSMETAPSRPVSQRAAAQGEANEPSDSTAVESESAQPEAARREEEESDQDQDGARLQNQDTSQTGPSIEVQGPTPFLEAESSTPNGAADRPHTRSKKDDEPESAIDILWENERGCFVCGTALFSGAALGNLDPSPWTNQYKKTSPTNIRTAQVPDPTWEWAWPEWRINREEGVLMDEFGWEYSFMFHRKFSWHGPKWWNSFVRRRAWIRKRTKKKDQDLPSDPHMLNTDYFNITPARSRTPSVGSRRGSKASLNSRASMHSKTSLGQLSKGESILEEKPDIEDIEMLMLTLRAARIDREKIEAVENYMENAKDGLAELQDEMHDIMGIFIFQASRRLLLGRLAQIYEEMGKLEKQDATGSLPEKRKRLGAAIKHADEEVRRLSYWSDVKDMAESGELPRQSGWGEEWQGLDQSGPAALEPGKKLP